MKTKDIIVVFVLVAAGILVYTSFNAPKAGGAEPAQIAAVEPRVFEYEDVEGIVYKEPFGTIKLVWSLDQYLFFDPSYDGFEDPIDVAFRSKAQQLNFELYDGCVVRARLIRMYNCYPKLLDSFQYVESIR